MLIILLSLILLPIAWARGHYTTNDRVCDRNTVWSSFLLLDLEMATLGNQTPHASFCLGRSFGGDHHHIRLRYFQNKHRPHPRRMYDFF